MTCIEAFKGAVCQYCLDVKPFNLLACSCIYKMWCEVLWYVHQNGRPWTAVYNNVQALVMLFLAYNVGINWREEFYVQ